MSNVEIVDVVPDGDIVFECPRDLPEDDNNTSGDTNGRAEVSKTTMRIRVTADIVRRASPVLKTMLSPRFLEGRRLGEHGTVEVMLPDDHGESMVLIFQEMHHRNDAVPETLPLDRVLQVAFLVDKYNCAEAMDRVSSGWTKLSSYDMKLRYGLKMFVATVLLGRKLKAEGIGRTIIRLNQSAFTILETTTEVREKELLAPLKFHRDAIMGKIKAGLDKLVRVHFQRQHSVCCHKDSCDDILCKENCCEFVLALKETKLWPIEKLRNISINCALRRLDKVPRKRCWRYGESCKRYPFLCWWLSHIKDEADREMMRCDPFQAKPPEPVRESYV